MIDKFHNWFEGKFHNRKQAFSHPAEFAYIIVKHFKLDDEFYYGEQSYQVSESSPYRQFVVRVLEKDSKIVIQNFDFQNKKLYLGGENLSEIYNHPLTYKENCDTIFEYNSEMNTFEGNNQGCNCFIIKNGVNTYVKNRVILSKNSYRVMDKGFDPVTNKQVWGSKNGFFIFDKYS
jgi:CpeT protein